jgi:hypothetical protein
MPEEPIYSTLQDYRDYFEDIAKKLKDVQHSDNRKSFFMVGDTEAENGIKNWKSTGEARYLMVLETYEYNFQDARSDNLMKRRTAAFGIYADPGKLKTSANIFDILNKSEQICDEVIKKMQEDKIDRQNTVVRDFDLSNVQAEPMGGEYLGLYGYRCEFMLVSLLDERLNEELWLSQ